MPAPAALACTARACAIEELAVLRPHAVYQRVHTHARVRTCTSIAYPPTLAASMYPLTAARTHACGALLFDAHCKDAELVDCALVAHAHVGMRLSSLKR